MLYGFPDAELQIPADSRTVSAGPGHHLLCTIVNLWALSRLLLAEAFTSLADGCDWLYLSMFLVCGPRIPLPSLADLTWEQKCQFCPLSPWEGCSFTQSSHREIHSPPSGAGSFRAFCGFRYWVEEEPNPGHEIKQDARPRSRAFPISDGLHVQGIEELCHHLWARPMFDLLKVFCVFGHSFLPGGWRGERNAASTGYARQGGEGSQQCHQWLLSPCGYLPSKPALEKGGHCQSQGWGAS